MQYLTSDIQTPMPFATKGPGSKASKNWGSNWGYTPLESIPSSEAYSDSDLDVDTIMGSGSGALRTTVTDTDRDEMRSRSGSGSDANSAGKGEREGVEEGVVDIDAISMSSVPPSALYFLVKAAKAIGVKEAEAESNRSSYLESEFVEELLGLLHHRGMPQLSAELLEMRSTHKLKVKSKESESESDETAKKPELSRI